MPFVIKNLILLTSIAAVWAADKDEIFKAKPAASYASRQTIDKVTIAAVPFETDDQTKPAFGKNNPNKYGVMPLLIVIRNDGSQALRLEKMRVLYLATTGSKIEPTPPQDVPYLSGAAQPKFSTGPMPTGSPRVGRKKNPLAGPEIDLRAFSAKMLAPGEEASGFFYFQVTPQRGAQAYVTGISEASTGKELFYYEIPLAYNGSGPAR